MAGISGFVRFVTGLVAAALLAAGCTGGDGGTFQQRPGDGRPGGSATPSSPSGTRSVPPIRFDDCTALIAPQIARQPGGDRDLRFGCGRMRVPLDHARPDGPTVQLFLIRVRLAGQANRIGSLVLNPGGPGGSGADAAVGSALSWPEAVLRRFDLVGVDPRGVGLSSPLECVPPALKDRIAAVDPDARTEAAYRAQVDLARQVVAGCTATYGDDLRFYSTEATARDLDLVRQALGDAKLSYFGYSYGTRLGSVYAQLFPRTVRALALDGAVDPVQDDVAAAETQAKGFENAFDQFAADCRRTRCAVAPDPRRTVTGLLDAARRSPISSSERGETRRATAGNVLLAVVSALYDRGSWPKLAGALDRARRGDSAGVLALDDEYSQRGRDGTYTNLIDANLVISCTDEGRRITDADVRRALVAWRRSYPLFGTSLALGLLSCAQWTAPRSPLPAVRAAGAPPILVIGTVHDPATPYASARVLARTLASGRLLTWDGDGHTAYPKTPCIARAVDAYLLDLQVPAAAASCPAR